MRIQTQVVWLPKIFIAELKNNLDIYWRRKTHLETLCNDEDFVLKQISRK